MEGLPEIDMIKLSGILFKFVGESKSSTTLPLRCFRIFNVLMMMIGLWFALVNFFFVGGEMYVQVLQSSILLAHPLLKYLSLLCYKSNIRELLIKIAYRFWNHRLYSRRVAQENERIYKAVERLQTIMVIITAFCVIMYMMKPFFGIYRGLLLESFVPHSNILDAVLLLSQFYYFYIGVLSVLGYDFIYFALCAHIILQLRLLKYKIRDILGKRNEEITYQISVCVRHHQFLFTIRWMMQNVYSVTLLFHYVGTLISTCALLLELFLRRTNFVSYMAKLLTILIFVGQFSLYAFPAEQVSSEFADLSDAIYTSVWYENNISNQKMLLYIMTTAQKVYYFSGAGLININADAFQSVFRKSFSFCTVFKRLIEK